MTDWGTIGGVAAVISAASIPLVLSATSSRLLSSAGRYAICWVFPSKGLCERLVWDDMERYTELHDCAGIGCEHLDWHGDVCRSSRCWLRTLGVVFSRAWKSPERWRHDMVGKPEILPLNRNYVCTDARTVLAFILCSVDYKPWRSYNPGTPWSPEDLHFDKTHVRIKELEDGTVVAHLGGSFGNRLTKGDIEGLLAGYPPWYREFVRMPHGPRVPHPIVSPSDINRAGWVVAVGLTDVEPLSAVLHSWSLTQQPIRRAYDIINERLLPAFPNDINVRSAADALEYLANRGTQSGVEQFLKGDFYKYRIDTIQPLSGSEATFAMNLFNEAPNAPLTEGDLANLTPILLPVVDAAFRGAYEVVALLKNSLSLAQDTATYWPKLLRDPKQRVFVEDCAHLG